MSATSINLKTINREYLGIYVADERTIKGYSTENFSGLRITVYGSKDTYYFRLSDGALWVYRSKVKELQGCIFVRDREEYDTIYGWVKYQNYSDMPENMFVRLEREYEEKYNKLTSE